MWLKSVDTIGNGRISRGIAQVPGVELSREGTVFRDC